jgi:hypothetical protein
MRQPSYTSRAILSAIMPPECPAAIGQRMRSGSGCGRLIAWLGAYCMVDEGTLLAPSTGPHIPLSWTTGNSHIMATRMSHRRIRWSYLVSLYGTKDFSSVRITTTRDRSMCRQIDIDVMLCHMPIILDNDQARREVGHRTTGSHQSHRVASVTQFCSNQCLRA